MATTRTRPHLRIGGLVAVLILFASSVLAQSTDDDYLKAIDEVADDVQVDQGGVIGGSTPAPAPATAAPEPAAPAASAPGSGGIEAFETRLASESRSLHNFYKRLSDGQKKEVFAEYQQKNDIKSLRATIVRLYTSR